MPPYHLKYGWVITGKTSSIGRSMSPSHKNYVKTLCHSDATWLHKSGLTMAHAMASCLTAPRHYLKHCSLHWRHGCRDGISFHRRLDGLLNRLFRRGSKKTSKLHVTGLCEGNSPVTGEFPAQRTNNAENVSIWWRHHVTCHHQMWSMAFTWDQFLKKRPWT